MSDKALIFNAQKILKDLGYDVKTTHLHELFARLAGFKNLHIAKAQEPSISRQEFLAEIEKHIANITPSSSPLASVQPLTLISSAFDLKLITLKEVDELTERLKGVAEIRIQISGGKYAGKYGSIYFLDKENWVKYGKDNSKIRVVFSDESSPRKLSAGYIVQITEAEYQLKTFY